MSKVAVVTGGAQGIGLGCVRRLQADGWRVAAINADAGALAAMDEATSGSRLFAVRADVSDETAVAEAFVTGQTLTVDGGMTRKMIYRD